MCWRLLLVLDKQCKLPAARGFGVAAAGDVLLGDDALVCYDIHNGFCACGFIRAEDDGRDAQALAQERKKLQRKKLKPAEVERRLAQKSQNLAHKKALRADNGENALDAWLNAIDAPRYLLHYWQDKNAQPQRFDVPNTAVARIDDVPDGCWVRYAAGSKI